MLSKALSYISLALLTGWFYTRLPLGRYLLPEGGSSSYRHTLLVAALGLALSSALWFSFSTAAMAEQGVSGLYDPLMLEIMLQSSVGDTFIWRAVAGLSLLLIIWLCWESRAHFVTVLSAVCVGAALYSTGLTGHAAQLGGVQTWALLTHVLLICWWLGLLFNMRLLCAQLEAGELAVALERFGRQAMWAVPLLLVLGGWLTLQLLGSWQSLFSDYGLVLLAKLCVVCAVLALAARHKLQLVPKLQSEADTRAIARSINWEMAAAAAVLCATAALTTVVGPQQ